MYLWAQRLKIACQPLPLSRIISAIITILDALREAAVALSLRRTLSMTSESREKLALELSFVLRTL
jgi:hypothetical protein